MRSGGYKCYNYQCSGRVGNSILCGEPGDNALSCADRVVSPLTRADHIRALSDEEMAAEIIDIIFDLCEDGVPGKDYIIDWLRQPWEGDNDA